MEFINVENMPLISIIVPCYNSERYLKRCIDSLLVQTYQNFELLLINDGSTDGTEEIIKSFQKDDRIRYFKKNNGGLSSAKNMGLDNHKGEYVLFVDSDDWCEPTYLENLSLGFDFDFCSNYYIVGLSANNPALSRFEYDKVLEELIPERIRKDYGKRYKGELYGDTWYDKLFVEIRRRKYRSIIYSFSTMFLYVMSIFKRSASFIKEFPIFENNASN